MNPKDKNHKHHERYPQRETTYLEPLRSYDCPACHGTGKCPTCNGQGCMACSYLGICDDCIGSGMILKKRP